MSAETPAEAARPRPVRDAALAVGGIGALVVGFITDLVALFVELGLPENVADPLGRLLVGAFTVAVALGIVRWSEPKVTPTVDPRDIEGRPLVAVEDLKVVEDAIVAGDTPVLEASAQTPRMELPAEPGADPEVVKVVRVDEPTASAAPEAP